MSNEIFLQLLTGIITIIGALISAYVIPYLKVKVNSTEMADLINFVEKCVKWANQTIPEEEFKRKKQEVFNLVSNYLQQNTSLNLSEEDLDAIIEAIVYSVKNGI